MKPLKTKWGLTTARYRIAGLFLAVALVFLSPRSAPAGFEEGYAAYERADYHTAFREMMPLALAGEPRAQFFVGAMYFNGLGVAQDDAEAVHWVRLAADQGLAEAQLDLGMAYANGRGVPQNYDEAVRWYRLAADQGNAVGQFVLGVVYYGSGVVGVPQDPVLAYVWLSLAAVAPTPHSTALIQGGEFFREGAVRLRDQVAARLSPAELAHGQDLARNWRPGIAVRSEAEAPAYSDTGRGALPVSPGRISERQRVIEVQQNLTDLGYDPGPVDGVVGPRTRAAIRNFQANVGLPVDGEISDKLYAALNDAASSGRSVAARLTPPQRRLASTGTGFAVSEDGYLVTNDHVVAGCAEVRVRGAWSDLDPLQRILRGFPGGADQEAAAGVVARDSGNDLALLRAPVTLPAGRLRDQDIRAGDTVVAVGFPLHGLLASEANVTTGTVSALAGIGNDARFLQVTVPVQPGSSGGPLLDLQGHVVGVVVGSLDALQVANLTGDIPQNVNFAIKARVVRSLLQASGVANTVSSTLEEVQRTIQGELSAAAVGAQAKEFTVLVECWK